MINLNGEYIQVEMHKSHYYLQRDIPVNVVIHFEKD